MWGKVVQFSPPWIHQVQTCQRRNMATLKDITIRLKSVKNIQKITQSMKMVSAAKFNRAERELRPARPFGQGAQAFYEKAEVKVDESKPNRMIVAISSDRGLCGAIHSGICKVIKADIGATPDPSAVKLVLVGDKARLILQKLYSKNILATFSGVGKKPPTFGDAVTVYDTIQSSGYEFEKADLHYNFFKSVVSYKPTVKPMFSLTAVAGSEKLGVYDSVDAEVLADYQAYQTTCLLYYAMKENIASEQSSRMTAMDSASKNAGEMIDKLTMTFNRTRQAVITKELIEIISGAAALK